MNQKKQKLNLIFDLDGTLIDSSRGVAESVNYALEKTGQPLQPPERIKKYIGCPLDQMFADFTDQPYDILLKHFRIKAATAVVQSAKPLAKVDQTIRALHREGYRMGIATTKIRSQVDDILSRLGWSDFFAAVSGGDEVAQVKPAPDIFRLTLKRMGVTKERTIVIGDTSNDVLGARAAGLAVIAIPSEFGDPEALASSKPDHLIGEFDQLPGMIEELNRQN